jgi:hypothetical protein
VWTLLLTFNVILILFFLATFRMYSSLNDMMSVVEFCNVLIFLTQYVIVAMTCVCRTYDDVVTYNRVTEEDSEMHKKVILSENEPLNI